MYHPHLARWGHVLLAVLLATLVLGAPSEAARAQSANSFDVTSTDDRIDVAVGDGVCDASAGSATVCTLRAAIMEANALGGRQIIFVPSGTYKLTIAGVNEDAGRRGDLDITSDMTITGLSSSNKPIIDGNGIDRVFNIEGNLPTSVRITNLVIRGGNATLQSGNDSFFTLGGGIFIHGAHNVSLSNCVIASNRALTGAGIAASNEGQRGGLLFLFATHVEKNRADLGSAAIFSSLPTLISSSTISANRGNGGSGGVTLASSERTHDIVASTIAGNIGLDIGGLDIADGFAVLTNVTISGNTATGSFGGASRFPASGGIAVRSKGSLKMQNVTVAGNSGPVGGLFSDGNANMSNTLIANNSGGDCDTVRLINGFTNLTGDLSCRFFVSVGNQRNVNPLLGPLALNGASNGTRTHLLLGGSTAIDRGSDPCSSFDQRGIRRPSGARCDIGAVEKELRVGLGTATFTPPRAPIVAGQATTLALSWTVPPTMTWTNLRTIDLQLEAGEEQPVVVRFSQGVTATVELSETGELGVDQALDPADTLTLFEGGSVVGTGAFGDDAVLEGDMAALDLAQSRLATDGPAGKTVMLTLALRLKQPLASRVFAVTLVASDDGGAMQGPNEAGALAVGPFRILLPLVVQP